MMRNSLKFTDANFQNEVLESEQPVLVDFWAPWCGPCRLVGPTIEELAKQYSGTVKVGKLNTDENTQSAIDFGIHTIPAVLLIKDGKVVEKMVGVQPKQRYEQAIQQAVASEAAA